MPSTSSPVGWQKLAAGWPWFRGDESYPLPGYSEFNPPPRFVRKPYGTLHPNTFSPDDPHGWPVTELEEALQLRPGLRELGGELLDALSVLIRGQTNEALRSLLHKDNPYWPDELIKHTGGLPHERCVVLLPLALSQTQDEKCQVVWTLFGCSEHGPGKAFWQGFTTGPKQGWDAKQGVAFLDRLLEGAYGETKTPLRAGFRVLPSDDDGPLPAWAEEFVWEPGRPLTGVNYLLTFRPFASLPPAVRRAYREGRLHLLPFPGSLIFWGSPYRQMTKALPLAMQIPLLMLSEPHRGPNRIRVPQAGWFEEPGPRLAVPHGPLRNTAPRHHKHLARAEDAPEQKTAIVLFSTNPRDLGLYNKPMGRNVQLWSDDFQLLLDGPSAGPEKLQQVSDLVCPGGRFGYRFQFPAMRVGPYELYWHRPLVAYRAGKSGRCSVMDDAPLGFLTAYPVERPNPAKPAAVLWPRLLRREAQVAAVGMYAQAVGEPTRQAIVNVNKLIEAHDVWGGPLPASFARRLVRLPGKATLDDWFQHLPPNIAEKITPLVAPPDSKEPPAPLTFAKTARRPFEVAFWKAIGRLSGGRYVTRNNGDVCVDEPTKARYGRHAKPPRDLDKLADDLIKQHTKAIEKAGLTGRAFVAEHVFKWQTWWPYPFMGGWERNFKGELEERNIVVVIPGRDRSRAVLMADHYDTAFMRDLYMKNEGGDESRVAAPGADDNGSATATLLLGAPVFLELSKQGRLACDVWLVHLTGEEFPADGIGARRLCQDLVQGTLRLRKVGGEEFDASAVEVVGCYVLDMIAHRTRGEYGVFQISPGAGRQALWLAEKAHEANETWNALAPEWNRKAEKRGRWFRGRLNRSRDPKSPPPPTRFPHMIGEVRTVHDPHSTLFNADSQTFSDAGVPVVLLMEDYDISRLGYHDTGDTMKNIDLDYGSALAAIAIEAVARAAT